MKNEISNKSMHYYKELLEIIKNKNYPSFSKADQLNILDQVATDFIKENSLSGYMSSIIIHHQLVENIIKVLIECSRLWIKLQICPDKIEFEKLDKKMFGVLIDECRKTIHNEELIKLCNEINAIRIDLVHRIIDSDLDKMHEFSKKCKDIYDKIFAIFKKEYDHYLLRYKEIAKYPEEFEELIEDFI